MQNIFEMKSSGVPRRTPIIIMPKPKRLLNLSGKPFRHAEFSREEMRRIVADQID
jgi:hypothetical protein